MSKYGKIIIESLEAALAGTPGQPLNEDTRFEEIKDLDSTIIVAFQINLSKAIGDIADEAQPMPEMTVAEFSREIENAEAEL